MQRSFKVLGFTALFIFIDYFYTLAAFGFYHTTPFGFNWDVFYEKLQLTGYQFSTSPLDFFLLAIFRSILLIINVIVLYKFGIFENSLAFFLGNDICNMSYSLIKLLAFADDHDPLELSYPGMWWNIIWNVIAQLLLHLFYLKFLCSFFSTSSDVAANTNHYEHLNNSENTDDNVSSAAVPIPNASSAAASNDVEAGHVSGKERKSTLKHVYFLLLYARYFWKWFALGVFFLTLYAIPRIFIPLYTAKVIASIVTKDSENFWFSLFALCGFAVMSSIFGGLRGGSFTYVGGLLSRLMRRDLFRSILSQEIAFFDNAQTGEIISRLTSDCSTIAALFANNFNVFSRNAIMVVGSFALMFSISWRLTLVTFVAIPPITFFTKVFGRWFDKLSEDTQKTIADANRIAEEVVGSMRTVRSFANEERECLRFEKYINHTLEVTRRKSIAYIMFTWMTELSENIILISVLCYGGHLVLRGLLTVDGVIAFLLYQVQLGENFYGLNYVFSGLMESVGASRKVFEYLQRKPLILNDGKLKPATVEGKVEFVDVSFTYPTRKNNPALKNVSFVAESGETIALVGPSGAGKSSIISLIEHFYESDKGLIMLDNVPIREYDHVFYHQIVALVAQEPVLYAGTVRYNILYGCDEKAITDEQMIEAAKLANIHNFIMETEDGYETKCGEKGVQMSGGQKQRIAIARALVRNPAVLILDEATSALDAESEFIIKEAIQKCAIGRTVIVIAHRLSTVESANRIIVVDKGNIVQVGNHQSLLKDTKGLYYSLARKQLLGSEDDA